MQPNDRADTLAAWLNTPALGEALVDITGPAPQTPTESGPASTPDLAFGHALQVERLDESLAPVAHADQDAALALAATALALAPPPVTVVTGTSGNDVLAGTEGADLISGLTGSDSLSGLGGDDVIYGASAGQEGYSSDKDTLDGGAGNDMLYGSVGNDLLMGGADSDTLAGGAGADNLDGGDGADVLIGGAGDDVMSGGAGADRFVVGGGTDGVDTVIAFSVAEGDKLDFSQLGISDAATVASLLAAGGGGWSIDYSTGNGTGKLILAGLNAGDVGASNWLLSTVVSNDQVTGTGYADHLFGGLGDDVLSGGSGSDWLFGESGNDVLYAYAASGSGYSNDADTLDGGSGNDQLFGSDGKDLLLGGSGNDFLNGGTNNDNLVGGDGADTLAGGTGDDALSGGAGADVFAVLGPQDGIDTVSDFNKTEDRLDFTALGISDAATIVSLLGNATNWTIDYGAGYNTARISLVGVGAGELGASNWVLSSVVSNDQKTGTSYDDHLFGGLGDDVLSGSSGSDWLFGETGNDVLYAYSASGTGYSNDLDTLDGGSGNDQLFGSDGKDLLLGGSGNDFLNGGTNNDNLVGGDGADTLAGSTGDDALSGGAGADVFTVLGPQDGIDTVSDFNKAEDKLDFTALGISDAATIVSLLGNASNWTIDYGAGYNTARISLVGVGAGELGASNWLLSSVVSNDQVTGTSYADHLFGGLGDDVLSGSYGSDWLFGETGNDVLYAYAASGTGYSSDLDTLDGGSGNDQLFGSDGKDLLLGGADNDLLNGGANDDVLNGGSGNDSLNGGAGNDLLNGGDGVDTADYHLASTVVTVDLALVGPQTVNDVFGLETLQSIENATGGSANDVLRGDGGANRLDGNTGNDQLIGRAGDDVYVVDSLGDSITELALEGTDRVEATLSWTLGAELENLTLLGTQALNGTGNELNNALVGNGNSNVLTGLGGDDTLDGGGGNDAMAGGSGNDLYIVDSVGDTVTEVAGEGLDTVQASVSWTLGTGQDNLVLQGSGAINGTGNADANQITGNAGNNLLDGGAGIDTLTGGAGNDTFVVDNKSDVLVEASGEGTDTVQSSISWTLANNFENLVLTGTKAIDGTGNNAANLLTGSDGANRLDGGSGADTLTGGLGADTLIGGAGNDNLSGGTGSDRFVFTAQGNGQDSILDLRAGLGGDVIDLSNFFGKTATTIADGNAGGGDNFDVFTAPATLTGQNVLSVEGSFSGTAPTAAQVEALLTGFHFDNGSKQAVVVHDVVSDNAYLFFGSEKGSDGNDALNASELTYFSSASYEAGSGFAALVAENFATLAAVKGQIGLQDRLPAQADLY